MYSFIYMYLNICDPRPWQQSHVRPEDQLVAIDGVDLQGISLILIGFEDAH